MSTKKALKGSLGALGVMVISQIIAKLLGGLLVVLMFPRGLCNIIIGVTYIFATYIILKVYVTKRLKLNMEEVGISKFHINIKWTMVAIFLPLSVLVVFLMFPGTYINSNMSGDKIFSTLGAGIMFIGMGSGFVEEMVFRGVIMNLFKNRWNIRVGILISSILFGAIHIIGMKFSILNYLLVLIAVTLVGIMLSLIVLESNSIWNGVIIHALWNIILIGGALKISDQPDKDSIVTYVLNTKNRAFTGGEFGIESSVIAIVGFLIVILFTLLEIRRKDNAIV